MNDKFFDLNRDKQDRMMNAALKVFARNGFRHASTDEIVREAAISKGLLFHYFTSKIGLYAFLFDYSVKYMLFEFARVIPKDESDYFAIRGEIEAAKLNVLRSYPYMNEFIERGMQENQIDVIEETEAAKNQYMEQMDRYFAQAKDEKWRKGISREFVDNLIRYCIDGLTRDQMDAGSYQPELLSSQISEYMNTIKRMAIIS